MANKTQVTDAAVDSFLDKIEPKARRDDAKAVAALMARISGAPPQMWGSSIVGFGSYHYRYDSGREGDAPRIGLSPRKAALVLYIMGGFPRYEALLSKLGKVTTGKACVYIKKLSDIDLEVLEALITDSLAYMRKTYPA
ncbi:DUF1801 domain-containing protein [Stigmatella aurantiaca]|uniref:Conserved uncharacterized protein n=1 Tax=Stigmatella aurantiaca (strain DW4/3-1) TaxID=378806 RepID=Q094N2_STIAD|nr:DUF1801 domain-containing protein [Stigmatella aurantiaca]ADO75413.1 conserved uncharacterized protein [Stigmatella aurantiaca DW4/3-1]EAU67174.1 conserved hypothetical protein [Stigmatella aurantiaca DW4/3-1]